MPDDARLRGKASLAGVSIERGAGGETHQKATGAGSRLTTQQGVVVADDQNTLRAALRNVDEALARGVAEGLGLDKFPRALPAAREPITNLPPSAALSILRNGPQSFAGRKLGVLVSDGVELAVLDALTAAAAIAQVKVEILAARVGGVLTSDGERLAADQMLAGAPSVLYDAVAVLVSAEGVVELAGSPAARDFVADAYAHAKFVGYVEAATALFTAAGIEADQGFVRLTKRGSSAQGFLQRCGDLRYWERTGTS